MFNGIRFNDLDSLMMTITDGKHSVSGKILELEMPRLEIGCAPVYGMKFALGVGLKQGSRFTVDRILKSGNRTIVFWKDGSKTIVKRSADTPDDDYSAFTAALAVKTYGSNSALKRMIRKKTEYQKKKEKKHEKVID